MSYDSVVLADSPTYYWALAEPSGTTATDSADSNTGTYQAAPTLGATGIGDGETAVGFASASSQYVSTATLQASPGPPAPLSVEVWLKTSSAFGTAITFGNQQTGSIGNNDRVLYMGTDGNVYFAIFTTVGVTVASTSGTLADGHWHHVVGVIAPGNAMTLYVDGVSVASNSNSAAPQSYQGFWRLASSGDAAGWLHEGTNFWNGSLAKAAIYASALTSTQITNHYNAASGGPTPNPQIALSRMPLGC